MAPPSRKPVRRNPHRKSRLGCRECKARHIKCDERHPSCQNCTSSEIPCSFRRSPLAARHPFVSIQPKGSRVESKPPDGSNTVNNSPTAPHPAEYQGLDEQRNEEQFYTLDQLDLLHHFEHTFCQHANQFLPRWDDVSSVMIREAFHCEYLMDILMAVAAAHKSTITLPGQDSGSSRAEATRLLSRSMAKFNAEREITEDSASSAFLFTACLGQLVLFETFAEGQGGDLMAVLERFVRCMKLHQGVREVVKPVWHKIERVWSCEVDEWCHIRSSGSSEGAMPRREFSPLWEMLGRSEFSESSRQMYASSIEALQNMLDRSTAPTERMAMVQQWLIRVPAGFLDHVGQRRPEALVILAYYGVLLHRAREFWAVGNAGVLLVRSITAYLGEYWAHYLAWPNEVLGISCDTCRPVGT